MNSRKQLPIVSALLAMVLASACQELPTQAGPEARSDTKTPLRTTASAPDFTQSYPNLIPGVLVNVSAYRVDANTWRVRITVIQCWGDMCTGTLLEDIYTMISPTDPRFESVLRSALDIDGDGRWDGWKQPEIDYQQ